MGEALLAAALIALISLIGVFFFGNTKRLIGAQRFVVPIAVGVFLSLVLFELIPETLALSPQYGGLMVGIGFIAFYILGEYLHKKYHCLEEVDCDRRGAAILLVIGDAIHNLADGVVLGGAFLIDPILGVATAVGLAIHEIPQEIVEFGVLVRAGFSRMRAALMNLLSASSIILGTFLTLLIAETDATYLWVLTGFAAGNLLFLAASDLLPRIHGNLKNYGNIWNAAFSIFAGFIVMTMILAWTHSEFGHGHAHDEDIHEEEHHDTHDEDVH